MAEDRVEARSGRVEELRKESLPRCVRCGVRPQNRRRGLCCYCHRRQKTRKRERQPRLPARPTDARPGTPAKVEVMRLRVARGERAFHPHDRPMD